MEFLSEYEFYINHIKGKENKVMGASIEGYMLCMLQPLG